ncbi:MAG: adenylosuccinate lyase [Dehalococcoidales bacterium]|nr:adenylosuccinate lyase [Dehalococcoidales bacterium]
MIERYSRPAMKRVWSPENRLDKWLAIEVAVCVAWAELEVVPREALPRIRQARYDMKRMAELEEETQHEVTAFLRSVAPSVGPEARYIHLGLTSSDIMDTGLAMQMVDATALLQVGVDRLLKVLERMAVAHRSTLMIGRTHGVHAEPITFGLKLAIWVDEMRRNAKRLAEAGEQIAVGKISGAVGTHASVPPFVEEFACQRLGLKAAPASSQIIQRDRHAYFLCTLAVIASSLDKMATEIRGLQRTEVLEAEEPFGEGQQGSSAMPHKRNPVLSERVSGLARVIRGNAMTGLENVALWHERDISHSSAERVIIPDACLALDYILALFTGVMEGLQVYPENMAKNINLTHGLVFSQRVLLALIEKGLSRQDAYEMVQRNAMRAWRGEGEFLDLLRADAEVRSHLSEEELSGLFDYQYFLRYVDIAFERLGLQEPAEAGEGKGD